VTLRRPQGTKPKARQSYAKAFGGKAKPETKATGCKAKT